MLKMKLKKTNAARILDQNSVGYSFNLHEVSNDDIIGYDYFKSKKIDLDIIFKTLVLKGNKTGFIVAVLPLNMEIDLKKLAVVSNNKSVEMIHQKDLTKITGYVRGGCSPLGMKKQFPTYIQEDANIYEKIYISGGLIGAQIIINPEDLIKILKITVCDFAKYKE
jgi:Cys-tRNA(Pro)/Cys-tRNA(Cys) deacylase